MRTYTQEFCDRKDKQDYDKCVSMFLCKFGTEKTIDSFGLCSDPKCYPKCFTIQNVPPLESFCQWFQKLRVGLTTCSTSMSTTPCATQGSHHGPAPVDIHCKHAQACEPCQVQPQKWRLQSWGWNEKTRDASPNVKHHLLDRAKIKHDMP